MADGDGWRWEIMQKLCFPSRSDGKEHIPWIKTEAADMVFGCVIILNAIVLAIDIDIGIRSENPPGVLMTTIQIVFLVIFVIELGLRIAASGWSYFSLRDPSGIFDTLIVFTSLAEYILPLLNAKSSKLAAVSIMRIFRLFRLARIFRLLHMCPELSLLISGLAASMQAVFWVFLLLMVVMYLCALVCSLELGQVANPELQKYFGSVGRSFYTHFQVLTLEGYPKIASAAGKQGWLWYIYFVFFIMFANVVLMNLVTGIVCESVVKNAQNEALASHVFEDESKQFRKVLKELLKSEFSKTDEITYTQFKQLIRSKFVREALNTMDICLEIEDDKLFAILDEDGSGTIDFDELASSFLRLRGSKDAVHSLLVQADIIEGSQRVRTHVQDVQAGRISSCAADGQRLRTEAEHFIDKLRFAVERSSSESDTMKTNDNVDGAGINAMCAAAAAAAAAASSQHAPIHLLEAIEQVEESGAAARRALIELEKELCESHQRITRLEAQLNCSSDAAVQTRSSECSPAAKAG